VQNAKDIGVLVRKLKFQGVHLHPSHMNSTAPDCNRASPFGLVFIADIFIGINARNHPNTMRSIYFFIDINTRNYPNIMKT
jgi:hypothetical protein